MPQPTIGHQPEDRGPRTGREAASRRSLAVSDWPEADRLAWENACRPAERLKRGGLASHLKPVTRVDLVRRYGAYLGHVQRAEGGLPVADAAAAVTPERVASYVEALQDRVSSVTVYGAVYKLRRMAQLLAPDRDFIWLTEIEKDLAFVMQPRSKFDRLVHTEVLVEAGLTLMTQAQITQAQMAQAQMAQADAVSHRSALDRARQYRDGLMVALLAICPIRLKNFFALEIGRSFKPVKGAWWIVLSASETKEGRADERQVPPFLTPWVDRYLDTVRPMLAGTGEPPPVLWLSSRDGKPLSYGSTQRAITQATLATMGIAISPHLFRAAAASSAAIHASHLPHLATAILHHSHPAPAEEHYRRVSSLNAGRDYAEIISDRLRKR